MYKTLLAVLFGTALFSLPLAGVEKTLLNGGKSFFSGDEKCLEYCAPDIQLEWEGRIRDFSQLEKMYKKAAPVLRLACTVRNRRSDRELLKALFAFMGQDPALVEYLDKAAAARVKALLPPLRKRLDALYDIYNSLEISEIRENEKSASGKVSFTRAGKKIHYSVKLVKRKEKWLVREAVKTKQQ